MSAFLPTMFRDGAMCSLQTDDIPRPDLFARTASEASEAAPGAIAAVTLADGLKVTFRRDYAALGLIQSFLVGLVERWGSVQPFDNGLEPVMIDPDIDLIVWTSRAAGFADAAARLWTRINRDGRPDPLDGLTTPSIYGNKLRMARTLHAIAVATLPEDSPVLDVMAGTGVVSRMLSRHNFITANDANPYAALLTRVQNVAFAGEGEEISSRLLNLLSKPWSAHASLLRDRYASVLEAEERFLHGELNEASLERYVSFAWDALSTANNGDRTEGNLITARYANAYFGVAQAIELDALRVAIDSLAMASESHRDLCLAALMLAACTCNPGPHFAQPRKVNSQATLRNVVERRARNVSWEFEVALRRLASREQLRRPLGPTTCCDWREAVDTFDKANQSSSVRTVYLDPPYSKLQYSRYYHVLNVLLANDYPAVSGTGRYPPLPYRFSSRFEYQPAVAKREFESIVDRCAVGGMGMMISYGERGFISIDTMVETTSRRYRSVDVFSEPLRHHSQGRALSKAGGGRVMEYVIVAKP